MTARKIWADLARAHRGQHGWTRAEAARRLQISESLLEKLELGDRRPQRDHPPVFDDVYGTPGTFARIYDDVVAEPYPAFFGPRVVHENRAEVITEFEHRGVPGLYQTRDYARATFRAGKPYATRETIEADVEARMERQDILARNPPPRLWTIIGEAAVRQVVGSVPVTMAQIDHLAQMSEQPNIVLQLLPFTATDAPAQNGPAAMFEFGDGSPPVAYLEGWNARAGPRHHQPRRGNPQRARRRVERVPGHHPLDQAKAKVPPPQLAARDLQRCAPSATARSRAHV